MFTIRTDPRKPKSARLNAMRQTPLTYRSAKMKKGWNRVLERYTNYH